MSDENVVEPVVVVEKKAKKKKKGYFNNEDMLNLFIERNRLRLVENRTREEERNLFKVTEKIGVLYFKISENLLHRPNFCNYDLLTKAEMISDAVYNCLRAGENYDVKFTNPFAYFTQISWNAFIADIKAMKKRSQMLKSIDHVENMNDINESFSD